MDADHTSEHSLVQWVGGRLQVLQQLSLDCHQKREIVLRTHNAADLVAVEDVNAVAAGVRCRFDYPTVVPLPSRLFLGFARPATRLFLH